MTMMRFLSAAATLSLAASFLAPLGVHAASPLLKTKSDPAVYFIHAGKRYAFPNAGVYTSWYKDFSGVQTVAAAELASYPLAGLVTYKPGTFLVKEPTSPTVYAVSAQGVLHAVPNEAVAATLYGPSWNTRVRDVADSFFFSYRVGEPLMDAASFQPEEETQSADMDANIPEGKTPAAAPFLHLVASTNVVVQNQFVTVTAKVENAPRSSYIIDIWNDRTPGSVSTCSGGPTCSVTVSLSGAPGSIRFHAKAHDDVGGKIEAAAADETEIALTEADLNIIFSVGPTMGAAGTITSFASDATKLGDVASHKIYAVVPGSPDAILVKSCGTSSTCSGTYPIYRTTQLFAVVTRQNEKHVSSAITTSLISGTTPHPKLSIIGRPNAAQAVLRLDAPTGPGIGLSTIVLGTSEDNDAIALCDLSSCEITVQFSKPQTYTAFTEVAGKLEPSESVDVKP